MIKLMKKIELSKQGKNKGKYSTMVDDEDFAMLNSFRWCFDGKYPQRRNNKEGHIRMHFLLMNPPKGKGVDHINGNPLDNQKANLRVCTRQQNSHNGSKHKDGSSKYKGLEKSGKKWLVRVCKNYIRYRVGLFDNEKDAAKAYDSKAKELFGDFAKLNFPL